MKRILTIFALLVMMAANAGAEEKSMSYRFGDIKSVTIGQSYSVFFEIHVTKGNSKVVSIIYDTELEKEIKDFEKYLKVSYSEPGETLTLGMYDLPRKFGKLRLPLKTAPVKVYVEMDEIHEISLCGASSIYFDGSFTADEFEADLSGASKFGNTLHIDGKSLSLDCSGAAKVAVEGNFKHVDIDMSGAASGSFNGNADELECDLSGAAKLLCKGEYDRCEMECSGAVSLELHGKGKTLNLEGSGACKLDAKEYNAKAAYVELSGACSAKVQASDELKHDVSTASKLTYYGQAKVTDMSRNRNVVQGTM